MHSIFRAGLPIFFIISGYYLLNSKIKSIKKFYLKRIVNIITPFLIYSFLHFLIINRDSTLSLNLYSDYFLKIVNGSLSVHFWFVYVIIGIYIFTPALSYIMNDSSDRTLNIAFITILASYLVNMYYNNSAFLSVQTFELPYINNWYLYFFIGGFIGRKRFKMRTCTALLLILFGYISTVISIYKDSEYGFLKPFDGGINMIVLSTSIFLLFARTDIKLNGWHNIIPRVASHTYGVYLIHMAILNTIYTYFMTSNIVYNSIMMICICFIISLLITYIIDTMIINRITMLTGASKFKASPVSKESIVD
ncbi:TPA: acyltransferase [Salmonella enterica subsp. enterica serovar Waycross]